jgi:hypothetical protein
MTTIHSIQLKTTNNNVQRAVYTTQGKLRKNCLYDRLRNLINGKPKKDKEEWIGQYCKESENQLNRGNTEKSYNPLRKLFLETPK